MAFKCVVRSGPKEIAARDVPCGSFFVLSVKTDRVLRRLRVKPGDPILEPGISPPVHAVAVDTGEVVHVPGKYDVILVEPQGDQYFRFVP